MTPPASRWVALQEHVASICAQHDIPVQQCARLSRCRAWYGAEEIMIAPIKSPISYAVALHEIGHILGRHQRSRRVLVRERWAWEWARRNAVSWTPAMEKCARKSLEWYVPRAREIDQHLGEPDDRQIDAQNSVTNRPVLKPSAGL
jgi:hypothetical protein